MSYPTDINKKQALFILHNIATKGRQNEIKNRINTHDEHNMLTIDEINKYINIGIRRSCKKDEEDYFEGYHLLILVLIFLSIIILLVIIRTE